LEEKHPNATLLQTLCNQLTIEPINRSFGSLWIFIPDQSFTLMGDHVHSAISHTWWVAMHYVPWTFRSCHYTDWSLAHWSCGLSGATNRDFVHSGPWNPCNIVFELRALRLFHV